MSYIEALEDIRWVQKRFSILVRDNYSCKRCGNDKPWVEVHHTYYENDKQPWEYPDWSLWTLCEPCHEEINFLIDEKRRIEALIGGNFDRDLSLKLDMINFKIHETCQAHNGGTHES